VIPTPLLRVTSRKGVLVPRFVDPTDDEHLDRAARIAFAVEAAVARSARWGELADELEDAAVAEPDPKLWRGLAHLAMARTESGSAPPLDPAEVRAGLFRAASAAGDVGRPDGPSARDFVAQWAASQGHPAEDVWGSLYADLPSEATLQGQEVPAPTALLHRYNVGLVQGLLRTASELRIRMTRPSPPRMRQLFRWMKFHQLLHRAERDGADLLLTVDGPVSLFSASTRYGRALAQFLPALVLHEEPWTLEATVEWTRQRVHRTVRVTSADGLVSHLPDTGAWRPKAIEQLAGRFTEDGAGWRLFDGEQPLALDRGEVLFPDFLARSAGRCVHVVSLGHWRGERLARQLEALEVHGPSNVVLLASRKSSVDRAATPIEHPRVVWYADVVPVGAFRAALDRFGQPEE